MKAPQRIENKFYIATDDAGEDVYKASYYIFPAEPDVGIMRDYVEFDQVYKLEHVAIDHHGKAIFDWVDSWDESLDYHEQWEEEILEKDYDDY